MTIPLQAAANTGEKVASRRESINNYEYWYKATIKIIILQLPTGQSPRVCLDQEIPIEGWLNRLISGTSPRGLPAQNL
jgi:hypothetical protein